MTVNDYSVELRNVTKRFSSGRGAETVNAVRDANLAIRRGEFFTLLGPSGCGKTTTLRLIAGFEQPTSGEVLIDGREMSRVPPNRRPVNTVFQNYALFPHMNVAKNVGYGLTVRRVPRAERARRVAQALSLVQLDEVAHRKPSQLSGGQQQRVALARALVNEPALLLLDEPLGALDLKLRKAMQLELKQLQEKVGITFVYVTHDQEEALTMSDRIAVMNEGLILQLGDPVTLYEQPANRFVADFIGESNFLHATVVAVQETTAELNVGGQRVRASTGAEPLAPGQEVWITLRPEKAVLASRDVAGLAGRVREKVYIGTDTRYLVEVASGEMAIVRVQNAPGSDRPVFRRGDEVTVCWDAQDARVVPE
jgi:spermidine/putrescine transport system ATP-binding protein